MFVVPMADVIAYQPLAQLDATGRNDRTADGFHLAFFLIAHDGGFAAL